MEDLLQGEPLDGKYAIGRRLGQGGMGAVYKATHLGTKRTVAVKVIHPKYSGSPEFVERFRREAEASGRLRHPNVVDVTDFGFADAPGGPVAYLVMEYLDGRTLADALKEEGRLSTTWVVDILDQVCSAVGEAHRLHIIHRDLKPDNIWLEPNRRGGYTVKVLDFGLAKLSDLEAEAPLELDPPTPAMSEDETRALPAAESGALTTAGSIMGTPLYMSPEQCRGEDLGPSSDIYSLGVLAYRMLSGVTPFEGSPAELAKKHCEEAPPPLRERFSTVSKRLSAVVMTALAKDPHDRPESAVGFGSAVRASTEGSGALLRHAVALYSENFSLFFKLSLLSSGPLIFFAVLIALHDWEIVPGGDSQLIGLIVMLGTVGSSLFAYVGMTAAAAPIAVQLSQAPLRRPLLATALRAVRRRWLAFAAATSVVLAMTFLGLLLAVIPGVVFAVWHVLYGPVIVLEEGGVWVVLRRARRLTRRVWGTVLVIAALQFTLPALVWKASFDTDLSLVFNDEGQLSQFGFNFETSGELVLYQLLNVFVTPLAGIMTALLYLKARHAGGEVLEGSDEADPGSSRA